MTRIGKNDIRTSITVGIYDEPVYVEDGGKAYSTIVNVGQMFVSRGGYASGVIIYGRADRQSGDLYVSNGGVVEDVTVGMFGDFYVSGGGSAALVSAGVLPFCALSSLRRSRSSTLGTFLKSISSKKIRFLSIPLWIM